MIFTPAAKIKSIIEHPFLSCRDEGGAPTTVVEEKNRRSFITVQEKIGYTARIPERKKTKCIFLVRAGKRNVLKGTRILTVLRKNGPQCLQAGKNNTRDFSLWEFFYFFFVSFLDLVFVCDLPLTSSPSIFHLSFTTKFTKLISYLFYPYDL